MEKKDRKIWAVSLLFISISSLILNIGNLASFEFPNVLKYVFTLIISITVLVLIYTSLKLKIWKKPENK